jgi:hypothetical protein
MLREGLLSCEENERPMTRDERATSVPDQTAAGLVAPIRP